MKNSLKINIKRAAMLCLGLVTLAMINGCLEEELPGAGSMPDDTPPAANFSYASDAEDFRLINFTNLSAEALTFLWDFGGGSTSTDQDPSFTFAGEDTYPVSLIATDGLGVSDTITIDVVVAEGPYQPIILEPGFESDGETGDARDPWDAEFSTVIQISSSPVASGDKAGKLPSDGARVAYQEVLVEAESNYDVGFIYTLTNAVPGTLTVDILDVSANGGTFMSYDETRDHVIGSVTLNDQDDPLTYVGAEVSFASGTSTLIAIMVSNSEGIEARFDDFEIRIGSAGAIPPSANFTLEQSELNFLEYTFTNSSLNAATYLWDFGDGTTSMEESPVHVYAQAGTYTVVLTVTSEGGLTGSLDVSNEIHDPVTSAFSSAEGADIFTIDFTDESVNAASVLWEFGDGYQFSTTEAAASVTHRYTGGPGYYTVTLTATSSTGLESKKQATLAIGIPKVLGGDFEDTDTGDDRDYWRANTYSMGEISGNTPYGGSSDGAFELYDGTDTESKTRGAKIDGSKCANADGTTPDTDTRYAYQEISDLDPGVEYYLEYSYNNADGDIVAGEILDGHYPDGSDALAASTNGSALVELLGTQLNGEISGGTDSPQWRTIRGKFTAPASGNVSIWMWAHGGKSYYDNIKILPAAIVEAD